MSVLTTSREIGATAAKVFSAFTDAEAFARWWGPAGFSNTFELCEFVTGGRWVYTMHGPDGKDYPNECVFREIAANRKVVIEHIVLPKYKLTITFSENDGKTMVTWEQDFENRTFATKMRDFLMTANNQNLERLAAEVSTDK